MVGTFLRHKCRCQDGAPRNQNSKYAVRGEEGMEKGGDKGQSWAGTQVLTTDESLWKN